MPRAKKSRAPGKGSNPGTREMPRDRINFLLSPAEHAASVKAARAQLDGHSWWKRAEMQVCAGSSRVRDAAAENHPRRGLQAASDSAICTRLRPERFAAYTA